MKKIFQTSLLLFLAVCGFTACEEDRDSNPTLIQPTEFKLNTPAYTEEEIDLGNSETINLSWSQPVYTTDNAPVGATYQVEVSPTGNFTVSNKAAEADESGATVADYAIIDETTSQCRYEVPATLVEKALQKVTQWTEETTPALQDCYIRIHASVLGLNPVVSNVIKLTVIPSYIELKDAPVEMWYLIGSCIGDGAWSNNTNAIGSSIYPMSIDPTFEYDKVTGKGVLYFRGYLTTDGFKLIQAPGSWDQQWGSSDGKTTGVKNDGGSQNICVPANGYYEIKLDTKNDELEIAPLEVTPTVYATMFIAGSFNDWSENADEMKAVNTVASVADHNHIWSYKLDASNGPVEAKFLQPGWAPNWGGAGFPNGKGEENGANIPVAKGNWVVTFNDLDGTYTFTAL